MAEFTTNRKSPRVDMTPMVDLGFLLITFFMLASSFLNPKAIQLNTPADGEPEPAKCSKTLTLLLDETNNVKFYACPESGNIDSFQFSSKKLRDLILKRQNEVAQKWGDKTQLAVLIKPMQTTKYQHVVDMIDNMYITNTAFVMAKMENQDSIFLKLK